MAEITADRVYETSTTTGTGAYTLAGALAGYRAFSAVCANADTVRCFVEDVDANGIPQGDWEVGIYTWGTGDTLARTTVEASSNSNAAVNWGAGTRRIGLGATASKLAALGVTGFASSLNTGAPNAATNASALVASGGTPDQDAVLSPKGGGAVAAQVADSSSTGGNKRGAWAVDWQLSRSNATEVASGIYADISGGASNLASGQYSSVGGGFGNSATGNYSATFGGYQNQATGVHATVTGGRSNLADGAASRAGGYGSDTRGVNGANVFASNKNSRGLHQGGGYYLQRQTTDATPAVVVADANSGTAAAENQITLKNLSSYAFEGMVVARTADGATKKWKFEGGINREASAAATALDEAVTPVVLGSTGTTTSWDISVTADTTLGCLKIEVTGAAGTTIWWTAVIQTAEVSLT